MRYLILFLFIFRFGSGNSQILTDSLKPFVIGEIVTMKSEILNEKRTLNIYLPEGYQDNDTTKYPVIYLLDGSADEDFIHVSGILQYNNFPWVNRTPRSILVGIANNDRKRDFTFPTTVEAEKKRTPTSGGSEKFMDFIEKELQPFIEKKYKTNSEKTLIGQSLGGLLAAQILLKRTNLFDRYILISPSLWWDNSSLAGYSSEIMKASFNKKTEVYIGVGKEGPTPGIKGLLMETEVRAFADKLKTSKSKQLKIHSDYLPKEDHATIGHQAILNAFMMLYPVKKK